MGGFRTNNKHRVIATADWDQKTVKDRLRKTKLMNQISFKLFEVCVLCLGKLQNAHCCSQGHVFCKNCIIENLVHQKKTIQIETKKWESRKKTYNQKQEEKKEELDLKKLQKFENKEHYFDIHRNLPAEFRQNASKSYLDKIKNYTKATDELTKQEIILQENEEIEYTLDQLEKPDTKCRCPADNKHSIKLKKVYKMQIKQAGQEFICWCCSNQLQFQKLAMPKDCGHIMCTKCIKNTVETNGKCGVCLKNTEKKDIIQIHESLSCYSSHNQITASYQPGNGRTQRWD